MRPYARYLFEKYFRYDTRYILREHSGISTPDFPAIWKSYNNPHLCEKYIVFRETQAQYLGQQFTHSLLLEDNRICTSFYLSPNSQQKAYGDFGNDAILIEFYGKRRWLILWFFEGMKMQSQTLYQQWLRGELKLR